LGGDDTVCQQTTAARTVVVSISRQHVWMCQAHRQVNDTPATTGATANGDPTPTGSWLISSKERDRYLTGPGYRDYVQYWIPFHGDIGFHDASWQKIPFGSPNYRTHGSHGCVHLPMNEVVWLYQWATIGNTVVTVL
jgi:lipoprotein-anchoring transpeptidase ErfK/SrfK